MSFKSLFQEMTDLYKAVSDSRSGVSSDYEASSDWDAMTIYLELIREMRNLFDFTWELHSIYDQLEDEKSKFLLIKSIEGRTEQFGETVEDSSGTINVWNSRCKRPNTVILGNKIIDLLKKTNQYLIEQKNYL